MIAIQEKAGKKRIKTKSKKSERGQLRGGWWQKNGNNHRYSGPQDRRTFADPENFFVKKINTCETHNLGGGALLRDSVGCSCRGRGTFKSEKSRGQGSKSFATTRGFLA